MGGVWIIVDGLRKIADRRTPTADQLIENQGWKMIDLTDDERVHARILLEKLPRRSFLNVDEVLQSFP